MRSRQYACQDVAGFLKMWPCQASFWSRWHDPVLGRWLGLTPEQPAHCLRGFPERPRAAPSRVGDPPGLGRRGGAQGAARGAMYEKRYKMSDPDVQHTGVPYFDSPLIYRDVEVIRSVLRSAVFDAFGAWSTWFKTRI